MKVLFFLSSLFLAGQVLAAPDEYQLGKPDGYPMCDVGPALQTTRCLITLVSRFDRLLPAHKVAKGEAALPLKRAASEPKLRYGHGMFRGDLDDYLSRNRTTGLLVLHGDTVLVERYQYDRKPDDRMNSFSMAKTIVAMLVGIAVAEGKIASIDDPAQKYVPELKGAPYGETPIRHLLTMSSGMRFNENYSDAGNDVNILARRSAYGQSAGGAATVETFLTRDFAPGERYNYNSADTQVIGLVLRAATGKTLADYLSEKIWQPMGAEADAYWVVDKGGYEIAYAGFNATVRDYARFGRLLANDGAVDGKQLIPAQWVRDATTVRGEHLKAGTVDNYFGYGYQTRVFPGPERRFFLSGLRGQAIYVDPKMKLVMVHTGAREVRDPGYREQNSFFDSINEQLKQAP